MTVQQLVRFYPHLYHMAEEGSWQSIQKHGLLSTSALLDLFEIRGHERELIEATHRKESIPIRHPKLGMAIIRDQKPMSDAGLRRSLQDGLTPTQWYRVLNSKVFFWPTRERLITLLSARAYRDRAHDVLTIDTAALCDRYENRIMISPMNSGCTTPFAWPRGSDTFRPIHEFPFADRLRIAGRDRAVGEVAVDHSVPNVGGIVLSVDRMIGDQVVEKIL